MSFADVFFKTLIAFMYFGIIWFSYFFPKHMLPSYYNRKNKKRFNNWQKAWIIVSVICIALLAGGIVNHNNIDKSNGAVIFFIILIPSFIGIMQGFAIDAKLTDEERAQIGNVIR